MTDPIKELGLELRETLKDGPDAAQLAQQRQRLIEHQRAQTSAKSSAWPSPRLKLAAALALLLLVGVMARYLSTSAQPLSPTAPTPSIPAQDLHLLTARDHTQAQIKAGARFDTKTQGLTQLTFSERSQITLKEDTQATLEQMSQGLVRWRIQRGHLHAKITPKGPNQWRFLSGPYAIIVLGTELDIQWRPTKGQLYVKVHHGKIAILDQDQRRVELSAGQEITIPEPPDEPPTPKQDPTPSPTTQDPDPSPAPKLKAKPPAKTAERWITLANQGDYAGAMADIERQGWTHHLKKTKDQDLLLLADVARYNQHPQLAQEALKRALRARAVQTQQQATFSLGRLEMDQLKDCQGALHWFERYRRTYPKGRWIEQARGLSLTCLMRTNAPITKQREVAQEYLQHHPKGAYHRTAEQLSP